MTYTFPKCLAFGFDQRFMDLPIEPNAFWPADAVSWRRKCEIDSLPSIVIKRANGTTVFGDLQFNQDKTAMVFTPSAAIRRERKP